MSAAVISSPIPPNQDRPLLLPSPLPSDHQRNGRMRTLLDLLNVDKIDAQDHHHHHHHHHQSMIPQSNGLNRWRILKDRLGCCGVATWRYQNDTVEDEVVQVVLPPRQESESHTNLAEALAADREYRAEFSETPARVSLMRLLEETADGGGDDGGERIEEVVEGSDRVCCVCMGRRKGAAFIPCGHTYCRVCSRELLLNRGSCPLCNQRILEILDIF